ncbi:protein dimerization, partial [Rhizoctonia solani]
MANLHRESSISGNPPAKRRHTEKPDPDLEGLTIEPLTLTTPPPPLPIDPVNPVLAHRYTLEGRATIANAAETRYFHNKALVYHFLDISHAVEDSVGKLVSCTLHCGICGKGTWKWSKANGGSTTNMNRHMENKHAEIWSAAERAEGRPESNLEVSNNMTSPLSFHLDEFYQRLTRWIVTGNQPFTEVENEEFQDMVFYLQPTLKEHFVKANAIRNRVISHASAIRQQTKTYLNSMSSLLAISCDAWTSSNRIAFLAITASWVTSQWSLKETLLDFVELKGAHDGQNMANAVATAVTELGITNKILALVSDNASNNGTLIQYLSSSLRKSTPNSRWNGSGGHIQCLAHIIHLAVMSLLCRMKAVPASANTQDFNHNDHHLTVEEAEAIVADNNHEASEADDQGHVDPLVDLQSGIEKIRKISRIVCSSPQRMEFFKTTAERIEEDNEQNARAANRPYHKKIVKNLILDVVIRWNSTYHMLEQALEFSEAIDELTIHSKIKIYRPYALTPNDWAAIRMVCKWLKFFRRALVRISGEKYPTLSFSLHIYFVLILYVNSLEAESEVRQNPSILSGIQACKLKLQDFLDKLTRDSQYYYYAMVLDPRYKNTLFKLNAASIERLLPSNWLSECAESFINTSHAFYNDTISSTVQPPPGISDVDEFDHAMHASMPQWAYRHQESTSLAREIQEYLAEPTTTMEPLEWWSRHHQRFPRLAAMARDYLCIPGSSVAVERVLSTGRDVISLRRASLSAETISILMKYRADIFLEKSTNSFHQV